MKLAIKFDGQLLIPIRTVPFFTDGFLDVVAIADIIASPDSYADEHHDAIVSAYKVDGLHIRPIPNSVFKTLAEEPCEEDRQQATTPASLRVAPAATLVTLSPLRQVFDMLVAHPRTWLISSVTIDPPVWNDQPAVQPAIRPLVLEGLDQLYARERVDSIANTQLLIKKAMNAVQARAATRGMRIDPLALPGTKAEFAQVIVSIETELARLSKATLIDYSKRLGYRWLRGTRSGQLRDLLGQAVP